MGVVQIRSFSDADMATGANLFQANEVLKRSHSPEPPSLSGGANLAAAARIYPNPNFFRLARPASPTTVGKGAVP